MVVLHVGCVECACCFHVPVSVHACVRACGVGNVMIVEQVEGTFTAGRIPPSTTPRAATLWPGQELALLWWAATPCSKSCDGGRAVAVVQMTRRDATKCSPCNK